MLCKICEAESAFFSDSIILNKYKIKYFKCGNCGFVQTEEPYWLEEAYSEVINRSDVGYVNRNLILSKVTRKIINRFFDRNCKYLDFGGGYGLFVRMMRDLGYDFYRQDKYCENIFANDFEAAESDSNKYELITAFELFEHLLHPIEETEKILSYGKNIFISTFLFPENTPKPKEWWYYGLEHGQHISLYSYKTFKYIASKYKLNFISNRKNLHILSEKKINPLIFKYINYYNAFITLKPFTRKKSLVDADFEMVKKLQEGN
jgi:2-polyprenyl-3-methyl-5-hydroxy-6-metoxy-1,4-benzoquinol methylase